VGAVQQRLLVLMTDSQVAILERNAAGVAINHAGDPRRGVGLRADGLPDVEWVLIPDKEPKTGQREFIYGEYRRRTEADFWIARYPVTYRQFQAFLDAPDGFRNPRWWEGLAAPPEHWSDAGEQWFKHWNHPRERVSWYDAIAFCRWLTEKAKERPDLLPAELDRGHDWKITLPTEWQWEKAARGHDGRQYPWGNEYEEGRANIDETYRQAGTHYLQKTTAVGMYPHNAPDDSRYGVADLSGNVWEWCLNEYDKPKRIKLEGDEWRVLRGGSWRHAPNASTSTRFRYNPYRRSYNFGFRVCAVIRQE
jgi:formylglycine-generating enzyme required for sulfatase activity